MIAGQSLDAGVAPDAGVEVAVDAGVEVSADAGIEVAADAGTAPAPPAEETPEAREARLRAVRARVRDPQVPLEEKRAALRALSAADLDPSGSLWSVRSTLASVAQPVAHQERLCLDLAEDAPSRELPARLVRISAEDSWGAGAPAVLLNTKGKAVATLPIQLPIADCLPRLTVRYVPDGPDLVVPVDGHEATARLSGPQGWSAVSTLTQISWVTPGWREGSQIHESVGARLITWQRWIHLDLGAKVSTFVLPDVVDIQLPVLFDVYVGYPFVFSPRGLDLRFALDVGLWSTACPTIRAAASLVLGRFVVSADFSTHLYPMAVVIPQSRPRIQYDIPFENYLFWSAGAAIGLKL